MMLKGLPVHGYVDQTQERVALVNGNKVLEERVLRQFDGLAQIDLVDKRWLAIARTHVEEAFMAANRAVFRPSRVQLPEDKIEEDGA